MSAAPSPNVIGLAEQVDQRPANELLPVGLLQPPQFMDTATVLDRGGGVQLLGYGVSSAGPANAPQRVVLQITNLIMTSQTATDLAAALLAALQRAAALNAKTDREN